MANKSCGGDFATSGWPGLNEGQLNDGRDLALTTDFRLVLGEILQKHIGVRDLAPVFPGFDNDPHCRFYVDPKTGGLYRPQTSDSSNKWLSMGYEVTSVR